MKKDRIEFFDSISGTGGKFRTKWQCSNIFLHKLKLCIFQDHSIMGPNQPVATFSLDMYVPSEPKNPTLELLNNPYIKKQFNQLNL